MGFRKPGYGENLANRSQRCPGVAAGPHRLHSRPRIYVNEKAVRRTGGTVAPVAGIASNWADAFQQAKAALEAGDLYRALWITHRVLLSALDQMDLLRFARWKTNRDYLRECRANHAASVTLADVSDAYERVVYAHNDINRDQAAHLLTRVEALVQEANR